MKKITNTRSAKWLLLTNFVTVTILSVLFFKGNFDQKIVEKLAGKKTDTAIVRTPFDNVNFVRETDFYSMYNSPKTIVMFGNSLIYQCNWAELFNRFDIANRGVGSDITEGLVDRVGYILRLKPKICFIEGGVNDLRLNIPKDSIVKNLAVLIDTLKKNNIIPVLHTVTMVADSYDLNQQNKFNSKIQELNSTIKNLATEKNVAVIDLNPYLTDGKQLRKEFVQQDGIHLTSKAYIVWKEEIEKVLLKDI